MLCRRAKLVTPSHGSAWYNDVPMERGLDMVRLVGSKDAGGNYGFAKKCQSLRARGLVLCRRNFVSGKGKGQIGL